MFYAMHKKRLISVASPKAVSSCLDSSLEEKTMHQSNMVHGKEFVHFSNFKTDFDLTGLKYETRQ